MAGQRIQVAGQRGHQRLAFAGLHLGDLALVQHHAADQLHVEVAHLHGAPAGLAHHRKGLGQNLVQRLLLGAPCARPCAPRRRECSSSRAAIRARNSTVLARNCSSVSCFVSASRALISATIGISRLIRRSFAVPKILVRTLSKNTGFSVYQCKWWGLRRTGSRPPAVKPGAPSSRVLVFCAKGGIPRTLNARSPILGPYILRLNLHRPSPYNEEETTPRPHGRRRTKETQKAR